MTKQIHRELFDKNKYISIIRKQNPNIQEDKIEWYDDGWDFIVAIVDSLVYRFPRRRDYETKLPLETAFMKHFASLSPIAVPQLTLHEDSATGNYVTYSFLHGIPFKRKLAEMFPKDKQLLIARQIGNFLSTLHSFPIGKAKEIGIEELNSLQSWTGRLEKIKREVFPNINKEEQEWTIKIFTEFINLIKHNPFRRVVTHSDVMPEHIIVNPDTYILSGIIDFGDILIADPAFDFTFLNKYGKEFLDEAYKAYKLQRDPYFEVRRRFYEDRLVITNLEHSLKVGDPVWIERHKKEFAEYLTSAKERDFLKNR